MVSPPRLSPSGRLDGCRLDQIVGPFADMLLAADFPDLPSDKRAEVVHFVERRAATVPSFTRFGVTVIGLVYRTLMAAPAGDRIVRALVALPLPILGEYPRLIRSLGYAYIWDRWPDTTATGGQP
jgi:hypothetical protein